MRVDTENKVRTCGICYCTKNQRWIGCGIIIFLLALFVGLVIGLLINAALVKPMFERTILDPAPSFINANSSESWKRANTLAQAIKLKTVSYSSTEQNKVELVQLHSFIVDNFPHIDKSEYVEKFMVNDLSVILRVQGTDHGLKRPYMLCAHLDVVPEGDVSQWDCDPFLGEIVRDHLCEPIDDTANDGADAFVYGRGAIDDKHSVFGILEALEYLVMNHQQPKRTFYIAFGHDEEVMGHQGAGHIKSKITELLEQNGEKLDFILDEGTSVYKDVVPGVNDPMVMISATEKGWAMLDGKVTGKQTHSSMPPKKSTVGRMAEAITKLEQNHHPSRFGKGVEYDTSAYSAYYSSFGFKIALANLWLFSPAVSAVLASDASTDSIQRTTTAVTMVDAGIKENIVPGEAHFVVNHRIHTVDNINSVLEYDIHNIDDEHVELTVREGSFNPPPISSYSSDTMPFQIIANSALDVYPDAGIIPSLLSGNTDTIHYLNLTENIYRFSPAFMLPEDIDRFHGINERISVKTYSKVMAS